MKRIITFLMVAALLVGCQDGPGGNGVDEDDLSPSMRAAFNVLKNAGDMPDDPVANEGSRVEINESEPSSTINNNYKDPISGYEYPAREVIREERYSMAENTDEFMLPDPWSGTIWPGNLIQGKTLGKTTVPSSVPADSKRKPGRISLSIVSGAEDMEKWWVELPMAYSYVNQGMNNLIRDYLKSTSSGSSPAATSYKLNIVQSYEEMCVKLGLSGSGWGAKLSTSLGKTFNKNNSYCMVTLYQRFYTMTYDDPAFGFKGVFTDNITASDLEPFTGPGNPICYVSSVSYGRIFVVLYESSESAEELHAAISASYKGAFDINTDLTIDQKKVFNESSVSLMQLGGDPVSGLEVAFQSTAGDRNAKLHDFVVGGATFSSTNIATPISFKINQLYNNNVVKMANTTEYTVENKYYAPVNIERNVTVNIWDFEAKPLEIDTKHRDLRSSSQLDISNISVQKVSPDGSISGKQTFHRSDFNNMPSLNGVTKMIYGTTNYQGVQENQKIMISCSGTFRNRSNASNNPIPFDIAQMFEYSIVDNKWIPVAEGATTHQSQAYNYLGIQGMQDFIKYDFKLYYRLSCDGYSYSYLVDGANL